MADLGLSGLASGVDTSSIVSQLMGLERQKLNRTRLAERGVQTQSTALRDIKTKLTTLRTAAEGLRASAPWTPTQTAESSDPAKVGVTRTGMALIGTRSIKVEQLASAHQRGYAFASPGADTTLTIGAGEPITVKAGAKAGDVAALINGAGREDQEVYAVAVDDTTLVLTARDTGQRADWALGAGVLTQLGTDPYARDGRNAQFRLDGDPPGDPPRESAANLVKDPLLPGLELTLKATTGADFVNLTTGVPGTDKDAIKAKLTAFVTAYNDVVTATKTRVEEKANPKATTDFEALKGTLFGDAGLNGVLSGLRRLVGDDHSATSDLDQLLELGLTTGKAQASGTSAESRAGKLQLDDAVLEKALARPAETRALLESFAAKLVDVVDKQAGTGGALDERLKNNDVRARRIADRMTVAESRIAEKEKRLKAQFAAMEQSLSLAQTQGAWLSGQIASLPTSR